MKGIAIVIPVLALAAIVNTEAIGSEGTAGTHGDTDFKKNECLLVALNCPENVDNHQQHIVKLQAEINKGLSVYTDSELKILKKKLLSLKDGWRW